MSTTWLALIELGLVFGACALFGWYQLRSLARYRDKRDEGGDE